MKKVVMTAVIALGVALPSLAAAMTAEQSVHTDKARMIFEQIANEARNGE